MSVYCESTEYLVGHGRFSPKVSMIDVCRHRSPSRAGADWRVPFRDVHLYVQGPTRPLNYRAGGNDSTAHDCSTPSSELSSVHSFINSFMSPAPSHGERVEGIMVNYTRVGRSARDNFVCGRGVLSRQWRSFFSVRGAARRARRPARCRDKGARIGRCERHEAAARRREHQLTAVVCYMCTVCLIVFSFLHLCRALDL